MTLLRPVQSKCVVTTHLPTSPLSHHSLPTHLCCPQHKGGQFQNFVTSTFGSLDSPVASHGVYGVYTPTPEQGTEVCGPHPLFPTHNTLISAGGTFRLHFSHDPLQLFPPPSYLPIPPTHMMMKPSSPLPRFQPTLPNHSFVHPRASLLPQRSVRLVPQYPPPRA